MLDDERKIPFIMLIIISMVLSLCTVGLMRHVENMLSSDLRIGLTEIASQNRDAIASRLTLTLSELEGRPVNWAPKLEPVLRGFRLRLFLVSSMPTPVNTIATHYLLRIQKVLLQALMEKWSMYPGVNISE